MNVIISKIEKLKHHLRWTVYSCNNGTTTLFLVDFIISSICFIPVIQIGISMKVNIFQGYIDITIIIRKQEFFSICLIKETGKI